MIKNRLIRAITVAGFSAGMLIAAGANAEITYLYEVDDVPAIVGYTFSDFERGLPTSDGFPLTRSDWLINPEAYSWNPANAREGKHPDRDDGVVYIFKNKTDAEEWWNAAPAGVKDGVPDKAVAYVHWALDNDSGMFPGIMAMTDDVGFQNNNCIMSSGLLIIDSETGEPTKKTCDNPPASAKRFKLVILQADQPVDIIFNMTTKTLGYENYTGPGDPNGDVTDDIFRNYRYLMKVGNGTGTDTVAGERTGTRLEGVKVELGFSDLNTGAFTPSTNDETDGLAWETRACVEKRYWDIAFDHDIGATDYCNAQWREVFLPHEFATFSPGMFASVGDPRSEYGGYWDNRVPAFLGETVGAAGLEAPANQDIKPQSIESSGLTANYFDIVTNQAATASPLLSGNIFGYLMPYGVIADGDAGALSMGIYKDDDGDPATEGSLYAWWDGSSPTCCYRWGIKGGPELQSAWSIVSDADLAEMEARPLGTEPLDPPRYEVGYMDDLGGLNMDTFIKITPAFKVAPYPNLGSTFTVRLTGLSAPAGAGNEDGPWVANPADASAFEPDVPVVDPDTPASGGSSSSGFSLSWITAGLLALGLLLRRRRF